MIRAGARTALMMMVMACVTAAKADGVACIYQNYEQQITLTESAPFKVFEHAGYTYVAQYRDLQIYEPQPDGTFILVAQPTINPLLYSSVFEDNILHIAGGQLGYISYDFSNPLAPTLREFLQINGQTVKILLDSGLVYLLSEGALRIIEPGPLLQSVILSNTTLNFRVEDIAIKGSLAYIVDRSTGLTTIDVSDPTAPTILSELALEGGGWSVQIQGDLAYVTEGRSRITVIDISDPLNPTVVGASATSIAALGSLELDPRGYLIVNAGLDGAMVYDISNPTSPIHYSTYDARARVQSIELQGDRLIIGSASSTTDRGTVDFVNFAQIAPSFEISQTPIDEPANDIVVSGDLVIIAGDHSTTIHDASNPESPTLRSTIEYDTIFEWARYLAVLEPSTLLMTGERIGLRAYDIADPDNPVLTDTLADGSDHLDVATYGQYAYVEDTTGNDNLVWVVDCSDPTDLRLVSSIVLTERPRMIQVIDGRLYVHELNIALRIYDLSTPEQPQLIGSLISDSIRSYTARDQTLIVAHTFQDDDHSIEIYDMQDPADLQLISYVLESEVERPNDVFFDGRYIWANSFTFSVFEVFDLAQIDTPVHVGYYEQRSNEIAFDAGMAFMTDIETNNDADQTYLHIISTINDCADACPPDLNADGVLNFFDVSAFIAAYIAQDPIADLDTDGQFTFFDVSAYLAAYTQGCP